MQFLLHLKHLSICQSMRIQSGCLVDGWCVLRGLLVGYPRRSFLYLPLSFGPWLRRGPSCGQIFKGLLRAALLKVEYLLFIGRGQEGLLRRWGVQDHIIFVVQVISFPPTKVVHGVVHGLLLRLRRSPLVVSLDL